MTKNKSHSGMSKRIKVTGTGKLRRERTGRRHRLERKSSKLTRRLEGTTDVARNDMRRVRGLLSR